jgi:hypothetical protein
MYSGKGVNCSRTDAGAEITALFEARVLGNSLLQNLNRDSFRIYC